MILTILILQKRGREVMDIQQAIDTVYNGLVSDNSVPVKLRLNKELDTELLNKVRVALDILIHFYKDKEIVPKKLALAMVDINGAFSFQSSYFEDDLLEQLEDIGIELQEKALELFLNEKN
ncbi:hypothetical protein [Lysinibacillus sp. FSL K6-3209]|uniref:hypothetical protein n=1 Tax=Lysinibacillus sp. FSL K6-3209 TaxID=2921497 RepID=UPI0030D7A2D5